MDKKIRVACIIGTRPEVIKMAPIIWQLEKLPNVEVITINTAQHRSLLDDMLALLAVNPNVDLNVMRDNQTLADLTATLLDKLSELFSHEKFDFVFAQGDTTTTMVGALVAFYNKIPYGHVEAGLRSGDLYHPFPEEANRKLVSNIATLHFAPTSIEQDNLLKEGTPKDRVFITGNTVIDALYFVAEKNAPLSFEIPANKKIILLTMHRRESFGQPAHDIFSAIIELANQFNDIHIFYPVHPNPNIHDLAHQMLGGQSNITLLAPLRYDALVTLLKAAYFILTDSGGLQEEAPALNKPLLILREVTERPLVVEMGLAKLVGSNKNLILQEATKFLQNPAYYASFQKSLSPYGDGHAAEKIVAIFQQYMNKIK